jgi:hypothetical protein
MPVVGTPTTPVIVSKDQIRMFMRDRADRNILLDDVQFSDEELNAATEMAVSMFNGITPQTRFTPASWPSHLGWLLLLGTCRYLMLSEAFLQIRNQATYQDGDIAPIGVDDKQAAYAQLAQLLKAEWDQHAHAVKVQDNMEGCYNSLGSGYQNVTRYNHS